MRRPILDEVKFALWESLEKSKSEIADSLLERDQLRPPEQLGHEAEIYPHRLLWRVDELAALTALFAALAGGRREQTDLRVVFPESVREQAGCHWRDYKEPFTPAELAVEAPHGIWRAWYRQQIRHWYTDSLLPGYKVLLEELRQSMEYGRWPMPFTDLAFATGTSYFDNTEGETPGQAAGFNRSGQVDAPDRTADAAPGYEERFLVDTEVDVEDEVVERLDGQQQAQAILKLLNPNETAWLERYEDAQDRGLSDEEFALEEDSTYVAFRKRKQRIRGRINAINAMSQNELNLGLGDRGDENLNNTLLAQQNEVLMDVRDRLDALLVGLEDTVSVLVWKFPEREAEIRGQAAEISTILGGDREGLVS